MTAPDLAALRADVLSILARLDALEGVPVSVIDTGDLLQMPEAERMTGKPASTIRRWASKYRLGRKVGDRWQLSRSRFMAFVEGR